ncbi:MAG: translation initiation factor IF-2 [Endomicrobium sp.]|jgi:translation initiation factor IF-2|nr:translation initiation factor IF-2 [Endomicrobium sp.]
MAFKKSGKVENPEKKKLKKKSVSTEKSKKILSKKKIMKNAIAKSTAKVEFVRRKTKSKVKIETVKKKSNQFLEKKSVEKNIPEKKKNQIKQEESDIKKYDFKFIKNQETVKKKDVELKKQKTDTTVAMFCDAVCKQSNKTLRKRIEQKQSSPKPKESKISLKPEQLSGAEVVKNSCVKIIFINDLITAKELADKMKLSPVHVLKKLLSIGSPATINQKLDIDTAIILASEFGYEAKISSSYSKEKVGGIKEDVLELKLRPPVVTIMGHVDHGKTSILDAIRSSNVVASEYGGITQHISAYKFKTLKGENITFLDTPGHEAFMAMRSRGVQVTDIVVLVVSAIDGVMPQAVEVIDHVRALHVPIIVAVNKVDLPASDPQKIRQELNAYGIIPEEWGGDTIMIDVSAKQKINIELLIEMILLKAEMMELRVDYNKKAEGVVIEARLDSRKGPIATLLVQSGTLRIGDNLVIGTTYGKVRAMIDEHGKRLSEVFPSTPVEVLGISEPPQTGDKFFTVNHESHAREIAQARKEDFKEISLKSKHHLSLADINSGRSKDLRIILKTDVQGSLGAVNDALERLSTFEINLKIIHKGAGSITESDIALAVVSNALVVGFNIRPDAVVEKLAEVKGVSINIYRVIYDLVADVRAAMEGLLDPDLKEIILGKAVVKQVFKLSTYGTISGCSVVFGKIKKGAKIRLLRDNIIVFDGNISSLKRFKDDAKEVEKGYECGIGLENFSDIKIGDIVENFTTEKISRKLDD